DSVLCSCHFDHSGDEPLERAWQWRCYGESICACVHSGRNPLCSEHYEPGCNYGGDFKREHQFVPFHPNAVLALAPAACARLAGLVAVFCIAGTTFWVDGLQYSIPAFAAFLLIETLIYFRRRKMQDWTDLALRS